MTIDSSDPDTWLVFSGQLVIEIIVFMFDRAILSLSSALCGWYFEQANEFGAAA